MLMHKDDNNLMMSDVTEWKYAFFIFYVYCAGLTNALDRDQFVQELVSNVYEDSKINIEHYQHRNDMWRKKWLDEGEEKKVEW